MDRRKRIDRVSHCGEVTQHGARVSSGEQRAVVSSGNPFRKGVDIGVQPDRGRLRQDQLARFAVHEGATPSGYDAGRAVDKPSDHAPFAIAEMSFAEPFENLADRQAGRGFDLVVCVYEGHVQSTRQPPTYGRFSDAHQADQHDGSTDQRRAQRGRMTAHERGAIQRPVASGKEPVPKSESEYFVMPRPLAFRLVLIVVFIAAVVVGLSFVDPTKAPKRVEKPVPENALAK